MTDEHSGGAPKSIEADTFMSKDEVYKKMQYARRIFEDDSVSDEELKRIIDKQFTLPQRKFSKIVGDLANDLDAMGYLPADRKYEIAQILSGTLADDKRLSDFNDNTRREIYLREETTYPSTQKIMMEEYGSAYSGLPRGAVYTSQQKRGEKLGLQSIVVKGDTIIANGIELIGDKELADEVFNTLRDIVKDGNISEKEEAQLGELETQLENQRKQDKDFRRPL